MFTQVVRTRTGKKRIQIKMEGSRRGRKVEPRKFLPHVVLQQQSSHEPDRLERTVRAFY
jgi:2'-5' RNA ligase